jgi:hypothetical protein
MTKKQSIQRNHKAISSPVDGGRTTRRKMHTTVSMRDLMSDNAVDPSEERHMSLPSRDHNSSDPSVSRSYRRASMSLPFTTNKGRSLVVDAGQCCAKRTPCYPRFRLSCIIDRQDLEQRLETFRKSLTLPDVSEQELFNESGDIQYNISFVVSEREEACLPPRNLTPAV